jgi:hypothetical protein
MGSPVKTVETADDARQRVMDAKSDDLTKALQIIHKAADDGNGSVAMDVSHLPTHKRSMLSAQLRVREFGVEESASGNSHILTVDWV